jgi:hypothetical protein
MGGSGEESGGGSERWVGGECSGLCVAFEGRGVGVGSAGGEAIANWEPSEARQTTEGSPEGERSESTENWAL